MKTKKVMDKKVLERFTGKDRMLAKKLDDLCYKQADNIAEDVGDLKKILSAIESGAKDLGCDFHLLVMDGVNGSPHYGELTVDAFCDKAKDWMKESTISVDFVDGEPGDRYMLCFHGEKPDDIDECAQFLFDVKE